MPLGTCVCRLGGFADGRSVADTDDFAGVVGAGNRTSGSLTLSPGARLSKASVEEGRHILTSQSVGELIRPFCCCGESLMPPIVATATRSDRPRCALHHDTIREGVETGFCNTATKSGFEDQRIFEAAPTGADKESGTAPKFQTSRLGFQRSLTLPRGLRQARFGGWCPASVLTLPTPTPPVSSSSSAPPPPPPPPPPPQVLFSSSKMAGDEQKFAPPAWPDQRDMRPRLARRLSRGPTGPPFRPVGQVVQPPLHIRQRSSGLPELTAAAASEHLVESSASMGPLRRHSASPHRAMVCPSLSSRPEPRRADTEVYFPGKRGLEGNTFLSGPKAVFCARHKPAGHNDRTTDFANCRHSVAGFWSQYQHA
ncbi:unnamed protein product [Protopolystoma xenopodis]|uniref:Uncharacterized protein n=1 Tax=Protopolystoma xenopodis TaxID=117903 RepID=A0A448WJG8_9PLAT|nr:unnamed protein product [Protopolystoma xenopodis]